jgi:hypothetical protein
MSVISDLFLRFRSRIAQVFTTISLSIKLSDKDLCEKKDRLVLMFTTSRKATA